LLADRDKSGSRDPHWFTALEDTMAPTAWPWRRRAPTPSTPRRRGAAGYRPFPRAALAMAGEIDGWIATMAALDAEDRLRGELAAGRLRDAETGTTPVGRIAAILPCAISISTCRQPRARPASRRRSWCRSRSPMPAWWRCRAAVHRLLLLDEIAAHSTPSAARRCSRRWCALRQCWMTGTDAELFRAARQPCAGVRVADGLIAAA